MTIEDERLRRWRLILGGDENDGTGCGLSGGDLSMDRALAGFSDTDPKGGLGSSAPNAARGVRGLFGEFFRWWVVRVMQRDALEGLALRGMLLDPEMLQAVEPDVHLVAALLSLGGVMPAKTKEPARFVARRVVEELQRRLAEP